MEAQRKPGRKGCIVGKDVVVSKIIAEKMEAAEKITIRTELKSKQYTARKIKSQVEISKQFAKVVDDDLNDENSNFKESPDEEFKIKTHPKTKSEKMKKVRKFEEVIAETADRFLISSDAVSHLVNNVRHHALLKSNLEIQGDRLLNHQFG